jgi:predicted signal transduction protein with EAL and GGDEF domain
MTDEEQRLVRSIVSYVRKMNVEGVVGRTTDGSDYVVRVGRTMAQGLHRQAREAADELFRRLRAT